jgi:hypothetical protein
MAATIWSTRLPRLLRSIASTGHAGSLLPQRSSPVDAVSSMRRLARKCAGNCTVRTTNTVGRFRLLCICAAIVLLIIITSTFCQTVKIWPDFFWETPHERIETRVDVVVLDAIHQ